MRNKLKDEFQKLNFRQDLMIKKNSTIKKLD